MSLTQILDLEEIDANLYRAAPFETPTAHLYGGQVAAQALRAAASTVPDGRLPHSLHGYFLRAGDVTRPTILAVDRDRDGGSFSARHVNALQNGEVIFSARGCPTAWCCPRTCPKSRAPGTTSPSTSATTRRRATSTSRAACGAGHAAPSPTTR
jgi:acyl-CoA thioesterase II